MTKASEIEKVTKLVKKKFGKLKPIKSIYLHGSILTNNFSKNSDVDLLFIVDDIPNRHAFLREIKARRAAIKEFNLDIGLVFYSEFIRLWHIFRPPTYFVWLKRKHQLLYGEDLLRNVKESAITVESIYKRAVDLAQGSRSVYLNNKNISFWEERYVKWLRELEYGFLYLCGEIETNHRICEEKICKLFPELDKIKLLERKHLPMETLSEIAESLVCCIYKNFIKHHEAINFNVAFRLWLRHGLRHL